MMTVDVLQKSRFFCPLYVYQNNVVVWVLQLKLHLYLQFINMNCWNFYFGYDLFIVLTV